MNPDEYKEGDKIIFGINIDRIIRVRNAIAKRLKKRLKNQKTI
jgi:hypothetical protein